MKPLPIDGKVLFNLDGFYLIKEFDGWHFWIENSHGEGMIILKQRLLAMLDKEFKEKF